MDKDISNSLDANVQRYEQQQEPEDFDPYELMNEFVDQYSPHLPVASPLSPGIHHFTLLPL